VLAKSAVAKLYIFISSLSGNLKVLSGHMRSAYVVPLERHIGKHMPCYKLLILSMTLEDGRCEILFSYWLAKVNLMEKSTKVLRWPHSQAPNKIKSSFREVGEHNQPTSQASN
jgi:hypothetical protein